MMMLVDAFIALMESEAGMLTYHFILSFSIACGLIIVLHQGSSLFSGTKPRLILGFGFLLILQIIQFISAGFLETSTGKTGIWLPVVDRCVSLLSLVIIIWLWASPVHNPRIDTAIIIFLFITLIIGIFLNQSLSGASLVSSTTRVGFNQTITDHLFQSASLLLILAASLTLGLIRPKSWVFGQVMLWVLASGHFFQLFFANPGDYPVWVRFFQIAAFPFLILLPLRLTVGGNADNEKTNSSDDKFPAVFPTDIQAAYPLNTNILKSLQTFIEMPGDTQACQRVVAILCSASQAEQVFLVSPPDHEGVIHVECGYNRALNKLVDECWIDSHELPILTSCLTMGRIRRLSAGSSSPDRLSLALRYNLENMGAMLFVPVISNDGTPMKGAIFVAGGSQSDWSADDQSTISLLTRFLINLLQHTDYSVFLNRELDKTKQILHRLQNKTQKMYEEEQRLREQLAEMRESASTQQHQINRISDLMAEQISAQATIEQLRIENRRLVEAVDRAEHTTAKPSAPLVDELRLALEELSIARAAISPTAIQQGERQTTQKGQTPQSSQISVINQITQEMRQALASVWGYTEVLLGESIGILGTRQRKILERIRLATQRFDRLLDDLGRTMLAELAPYVAETQLVKLSEVISAAQEETAQVFQMRQLELQSLIPDNPIEFTTDPEALKSMLEVLLRNAAMVTPEGGKVALNARLEQAEQTLGVSSEAAGDFALIQVIDQGGGVSPEDIPQIFSPQPEVKTPIGVGVSGVELARMRSIVEALGGRTWVDVNTGEGTIFSILIPVVDDRIRGEIS